MDSHMIYIVEDKHGTLLGWLDLTTRTSTAKHKHETRTTRSCGAVSCICAIILLEKHDKT